MKYFRFGRPYLLIFHSAMSQAAASYLMCNGGKTVEESRTKSLSNSRRLSLQFPNVAHSAGFVDPILVINERELTKRVLAAVQRKHGTALIACNLPEHKPPVNSRMT